ncbi:MAG TPA: hypothetical protein VN461_10290 [Vicinamibacteria bacterium]|nr:hypothetical protein [Vicinamibacteria bacterium]
MGHARGATLVLAAVVSLGKAEARALDGPEMTPERVRQAISWGLSAPERDLEQYEIRADRNWVLNFDTPFLRVAQFSRAMKIQNQPISEADLSPKLVAGELHVYAHAKADSSASGSLPLPNIEYIVIMKAAPDGPAETILPTTVLSFIRRVPPSEADPWGPTKIARSVKATFPLQALAPGNEVRILFEGGLIQTVRLEADLLARVR